MAEIPFGLAALIGFLMGFGIRELAEELRGAWRRRRAGPRWTASR